MPSLRSAIPEPAALLAAIDAGCTNHGSALHGQAHWRAVAWTGLELLASEPEADPAVVLLFAMFHDSMRLDDGHDPQHGPRAAVFARSLHGQHFHLAADRLRWLERACDEHTTGGRAENRTVAVCFDADRLNLWRIGVRPDPHYLSTAEARRPLTIERAAKLEGQRHPWADLVRRYEAFAEDDGRGAGGRESMPTAPRYLAGPNTVDDLFREPRGMSSVASLRMAYPGLSEGRTPSR